MRYPTISSHWSGKYFLILFALAAAYFATARIGLALQPVGGFATLVWPPSGIALAVLFMFGARYWPGVFVGAFAANIFQGASLAAALGIAAGNTLAALVAVHLLHNVVHLNGKFISLRHVVGFIFFGAFFGPLISSTIGTLTLYADGIINKDLFLRTFGAWWIGDSFGIIIFAPLIFSWFTRNSRLAFSRLAIVCLIMAVQIAVTLFLITNSFDNILFSHPTTFLFPLMLFGALSFGMREVTLINATTALAAAFGIVAYRSSAQSIIEQLIPFQLLVIILVATTLLINSTVRRQRAVSYKLRQTNRLLKDELKKTKELERMKDDFVSLASHQLRTPLTATKWLIETLHNRSFGTLTLKQESYTQKIYQINEKMIALVSETLKTFRLESIASGTKREAIPAGEVVDAALTLIEDAARKNSVSVVNKVNGSQTLILTDRELLKTALECFLANAVAYSKPDQQVIADYEEKPDAVVFSVTDNGIGIPESEKDKLFDRFHRASNAIKYKPDGTGLGLYMAERIAQKIGGNIWFDSIEGKSTTFYISVPKATV